MRNILIIDNSLGTTGAFNAIRYNALELKKEFNFAFVLPKASKNDKVLEANGFPVYYLNMIEISRNYYLNILYIPRLILNTIKLKKIIRDNNIHVVHVNDIYNLLGVTATLFSKIQLIVHVRRLKNSFPKFFFEMWIMVNKIFATKLVAVSQAVEKQIEDKKTTLIYDRLLLEERYSTYLPQSNTSPFKMLFLANYTFGKGQQHAVQVMDILVNKEGLDKITLTFGGSDFGNLNNQNFKGSLTKRVEEYELTNHVFFKNYIEDVEKEMKMYDAVLNFSESESFSYTCAEALFYGIPLIATDSGGPSELFENEISGILVQKGDYTQMAESIKQLAANVEIRKQYSQNSKIYVKLKFSFENTTRRLMDLYLNL